MTNKFIEPITQDYVFTKKEISDRGVYFASKIMMQCCLPRRRLPAEQRTFKIINGNAGLFISKGDYPNPNIRGEWIDAEVPHGSLARLIMMYINNQYLHIKNPYINMGKSIRELCEILGVEYGGTTANEIRQQLYNLASCGISFGFWGEKYFLDRRIRIFAEVKWDKDMKTRIFENAILLLSPEYIAMLGTISIPIIYDHILKLKDSPVAMDLYAFLVDRLRRISIDEPIKMKWTEIKELFGAEYSNMKAFKQNFKIVYKKVKAVYLEAIIDLTHAKYVTLYHAASPIPLRKNKFIV